MADIGALPNRTCVEITTTDGQNGTIPGATPRAAGVMTAEQARQLDELWTVHKTKAEAGASALVIKSEPQIDTSQFATRLEVQQALNSLPKPADMGPTIAALRTQVADVQRQLVEAATPRQPAQPIIVQQEASGEVVDARARGILSSVIEGMDGIERRVADIEAKFETFRLVAQSKAAGEAA